MTIFVVGKPALSMSYVRQPGSLRKPAKWAYSLPVRMIAIGSFMT
jgi:hypothetical protein